MFHKTDGFVRDYDETKYFVLLGEGKWDEFMIVVDIL